jgi:HD-like signal output (HDOD) protein
LNSPIGQLSPAAQDVSTYLDTLVKEKWVEVPLLPEVANRVLTLSNDPDSDAAQLARLIQSDQALAGHVMRIANSAAYTPNASMVSLQQAIARLGMNLIAEMALAATMNSKMFKAPGFEARIADIWSHALCTALWGKELARISKKNVEASFLCGLLHSIGRPAILQAIAEYTKRQKLTVDKQEALMLEQIHHTRFGSVIVEKWEMPIIVQESVRHYQEYEQAKSHRDQAMVIHGAAQLAAASLWPDSFPMQVVLQDAVFADLNLYEDEIEKLLGQAEKVTAGMEAMRT